MALKKKPVTGMKDKEGLKVYFNICKNKLLNSPKVARK